jgi:16S rRNA (cytidine1402-2'-O)-methyltransferase
LPGTLFVVATPIGNLEDLTFRALRTLKEVDLIAAEDTRRTSKLLAHYQINKPVVSVHEHNEHRAADGLVGRLAAGVSIALVTDAGTPGISDPGALVVRAARAAGMPVVAIPGASAVATALSISGFSGDQFVFLGFPPRSGRARDDWFEALALETRVSVMYEAPHRILRTVDDLNILVKKQIIVFRELTKINEECVVSPISNLLRDQGEFTIVVGPAAGFQSAELDAPFVYDLFGRMTELAGLSQTDAIAMLATHVNASPARIAKIVKKASIAKKQSADREP